MSFYYRFTPAKCISIAVLVLFLSPILVQSTSQPTSSLLTIGTDSPSAPSLSSVSLSFTENQGQFDERVRFWTGSGQTNIWITNDGVVYHFMRPVSGTEQDTPDLMDDDPMIDRDRHTPVEFEHLSVKTSFPGASPNPVVVGEDQASHNLNFLRGNDPARWHTDVPNFHAVRFEEIYQGIDLKYYGKDRHLEYDFLVSPGADISQIHIRYEGADALTVNDNGELVISTAWGTVTERSPVIYQVTGNRRVEISGTYALRGTNTFGFELSEAYDPALPIIIDPVLVFSTYLGGVGSETDWDLALDQEGNTYLTGYTYSPNFPVTNPFQGTLAGGFDGYVCKLNAAGDALVYATYLGGGDSDWPHGIEVDAAGQAYVTGMTKSSDFPTVNPLQSAIVGDDEVFVTKLNAAGNGLIYSTFIGGDYDDFARSIAIDDAGAAYIIGFTESRNFPTLNAFQASHGGSVNDAFVCKVNPAGDALVFSTYLGGSEPEEGWGIDVEDNGRVTVTGMTGSPDFPTANALQPVHGGGGREAFVTKFLPGGNDVIYSTFLGGSDKEVGRDLQVDGAGNAYIVGETRSPNFPTMNALQPTFHGFYDTFISKLNPSGSAFIYSTFLGGDGADYTYRLDVDEYGCLFGVGHTVSTDYPVVDAVQPAHSGLWDATVFKLSAAGDELLFSTHLGGSGQDFGHGVAANSNGNIVHIAGYTESSDFPVINALQGAGAGDRELYAAKICLEDILPPVISCPSDITIYCGDPIDPSFTGEATAFDDCDSAPVVSYTDIYAGDCPFGQLIHRTWIAEDGSGRTSQCTQTITVLGLPYICMSETSVLPGQNATVTITAGNMPPIGGFDLLIAYDESVLRFLNAEAIGDLVAWEYFTYRYSNQDNCGGGCPSGLIRLIAIGDMPDGLYPGDIFEPDGEVVALRFATSDDRSFIGQCAPVKFYWIDCGDNAVSTQDGQTAYIDQLVYEFGNLIWDEDDDDEFPDDGRIPNVGTPDNCLGNSIKGEFIRLFVFCGGRICIVPPEDDRGDINLNGIANEVSDAVTYANYFIYGPEILGYGLDSYYENRVLASDINDDGIVLTVADLVYLIRIITGDANPFPESGEGGKITALGPPAVADWRLDGNRLDIGFTSEAGAGAVFLAIDHDGAVFGEPILSERASAMTVISHNDGAQLRLLVYSMSSGATVPAGNGAILTIPILTADPGVVLAEAEAADYHGNLMTVEIARTTFVPTEFSLFQNTPNPFNAATRFDFNLPEPGEVSLVVYDVLGRRVSTVVEGYLEAGAHQINWNARGDAGTELASGVYFYRITTQKHHASRKMVLIK